ncbi:MAG: RagB/SusD family nutrient uptake outer membrane protein, partial [Bacteroidales bacterium]|nr:RagB/SusD family nutrient uptake outer membrane protein [Bacteroidales bacterium]
LTNGTSGEIVVSPSIKRVWDENKDYFYPIPLQDLQLNPNLVQNPGWDTQ